MTTTPLPPRRYRLATLTGEQAQQLVACVSVIQRLGARVRFVRGVIGAGTYDLTFEDAGRSAAMHLLCCDYGAVLELPEVMA